MADRRIMITDKSLEKEAKRLGATHKRLYYTKTKPNLWGARSNEVFSHHFFDENDEEIAYYIDDMKTLCGMVVFETPRIWSEEFKKHPNYTLVNYVEC